MHFDIEAYRKLMVKKVCPKCGNLMFQKRNLIGLPFYRCMSGDRSHSIPIKNKEYRVAYKDFFGIDCDNLEGIQESEIVSDFRKACSHPVEFSSDDIFRDEQRSSDFISEDVDDPVYIHKPESVITGWDYSDLIEEAEDRTEERRAIYGSEHI